MKKILLTTLALLALSAIVMSGDWAKPASAYVQISDTFFIDGGYDAVCTSGFCHCARDINGNPTTCCKCSCGGGPCVGEGAACGPHENFDIEDISMSELKVLY